MIRICLIQIMTNSYTLKRNHIQIRMIETLTRIPIERKDFDKPENSDNPFEFNIIKDDTKEDNALEDNNCESPQ